MVHFSVPSSLKCNSCLLYRANTRLFQLSKSLLRLWTIKNFLHERIFLVFPEHTKTLHKASLISLCFVTIDIVQLMSVGCRLRTIIYCPQIVFTLSYCTHVISSCCIFKSFDFVRVKFIWPNIKALTCP